MCILILCSLGIAKIVKNSHCADICNMQMYFQILWIICYPVSRDQFVNLCPAKTPKFGLDSSSNFADHGLDSSSKVNLFRLAFVQLGGGVWTLRGICLTIVKAARVDHSQCLTREGLTRDPPTQQGLWPNMELQTTRQGVNPVTWSPILSLPSDLNLKWPQVYYIVPQLTKSTITRLELQTFYSHRPKQTYLWTELAFYLRSARICNIS